MSNTEQNAAPIEKAPDKTSGVRSFFRHNSLQLAGMLNLIGDVGFLMQGHNDLKKAKLAGDGIKKTIGRYTLLGGALYTLGGLNLTLFGRVKERKSTDETSRATAEFLQQKLGALPKDSGLETVANTPPEPAKKANFFDRNAATSTLIAYTAGAMAILAAGIKTYRANPKEYAGMGYGISSLAVKSLSLMIPERAKKESDNPEKSSGGFVNWIREKPLRVFGYGSVLTDSLLAWKAVQEHKAGKKPLWSIVTAGTYILADYMMAISNKDKDNAVGTLSHEDQQRVETLAAETIAAQTPQQREALVTEVGSFLAKRPEMKGSRENITAAIRAQVEQQGKNRWASRTEAEPNPAETAR